MAWLSVLPTLNACLNAASAVCLISGYRFIRSGRIAPHRLCMLLACVTSVVFLISYVVYHAHVGTTRFLGTGWIRPVYFSVLVSHTALAVVIVPIVVWTLVLALRQRFQAHRRLARVTFPVWLYVSVTGVLVYWLLYRLPGNR